MKTTILIPLLMVVHISTPQTMDELIKRAFQQMNSDFTSRVLHDDHGGQSTVGDAGPMIRVDMDMLFTAKQWADIQSARQAEKSVRQKRKALRQTYSRWTNNVVPYEFTRGHFNKRETNLVLAAMGEWEKHTCITFRPATTLDHSKIYFRNGAGCSSNVGQLGWRQAVSLAPGCRIHRIIVHEVGHAIGMIHEQSRPDRDSHVIIHHENVNYATRGNFKTFPKSTIKDYGIPYDYRSIMHYGETAFAVNPSKRTITTKDPYYQRIIGTAGHLSFRDIKLANLMYNCAARNKCRDVKCPKPGFLDKDCECMCPGDPTKLCTEQTITTTLPDTTTTRQCINKGEHCGYWVRLGHCKGKFKAYMAKNCPLACKLCDQRKFSTTPATTTTARPTTTSERTTTKKAVTAVTTCVDKNYRCGAWSSNGHCRDARYLSYMKLNCAKSCTFCTTKKANCVNKKSNCSAWKKLGYCTGTYRAYMTKYCALSCGRCSKPRSLCPLQYNFKLH